MDDRVRTIEDMHEAVADLIAERRVQVGRDADKPDAPGPEPLWPVCVSCSHHTCRARREYTRALREYEATVRAWTPVVSLWEQMGDAIQAGADRRAGAGGPLAERSPGDLDIMEVMQLVTATVHLELTRYGKTARPTLPESLRLLAVTIAADEAADVDWWAYRVESWSHLAQHFLGQSLAEKTQPKRLRDTPCPQCHIDYVQVEIDDGPAQARPLLVDFVGLMVRAVECTACAKAWFRGEDLYDLGALIDADRYRRYWTVEQAEYDAWVEEIERCHDDAILEDGFRDSFANYKPRWIISGDDTPMIRTMPA